MKHYEICIRNGKYIHEYRCVLLVELHLWRFKWWMEVRSQKGPLIPICHIADRWSTQLHCNIEDRSIKLMIPFPPDRFSPKFIAAVKEGLKNHDKAKKLMASNPTPVYKMPDLTPKQINLNKKK